MPSSVMLWASDEADAGQPMAVGEGAGQRVGVAIGACVVGLHVVNDSGQLLELLLGLAGLAAA